MRDRLIKLLNEAKEKALKTIGSMNDGFGTWYADHLLAEGVIVPPVKLGSNRKVYYPIKGTPIVLETKVYGIGVDEDGDIVINPTTYPEKVIEIRGVGKTVFLTREEAISPNIVEVVYCKDCVHHDDCICVVCEEGNTVVCKKLSRHFPKDHFCSYGERREG